MAALTVSNADENCITLGKSALTVHNCAESSEQSTIVTSEAGDAPAGVMHQSPYAIRPGTPLPKMGNNAVKSFVEPSPQTDATSDAPEAPNSGPKQIDSSVQENQSRVG